MAQIFTNEPGRMSFDGIARFQQDVSAGGAGPSGTKYAFANERISFISSDNPAFPDLIDAVGIRQNLVYGKASGVLQIDGVVTPDRGLPALVQSAFGVRTSGQLDPWVMALIAYGLGGGTADTAVKATGLWWNRFRLAGQDSMDGAQAMLRFSLSGLVADPKNALGGPSITAGSGEGTQGKGISSFAQMTFSDGNTAAAPATPVIYDGVKSFEAMYDNKLKPKPGIRDPANRIGNGFAPGILDGQIKVTQLKDAANPLPRGAAPLPLTLLIPTGDGTSTWTLDHSVAYVSQQEVMTPDDFVCWEITYNLFGKNTVNGATAYMFNSVYA